MAQPTDTPSYVVLPASFSNGMTQTIIQFDNFRDAEIEALKLTAQNDQQYFIYKATHFTDKVEDWSDTVLNTLVQEIVEP